MQYSNYGCRRRAMLKFWALLFLSITSVQPQSTEEGSLTPCELESIINQLTNPSPEYQLHASALRSQLKNILRSRQTPTTNELNLDDYDLNENDKRSIASLASTGQGYMSRPFAFIPKRSLATLAKNGQLPTPEPEDVDQTSQWVQKRYLASLARSGGMRYTGKRNIGSLARDYQLPPPGKRNVATLARLGLLSPKRNIAALARYNSGFRGAQKKNLAALKASQVHGQQKKDSKDQDILNDPVDMYQRDFIDYADQTNDFYPVYDDYADMEKRFLGRVLPPTRATTTTHRSRL